MARFFPLLSLLGIATLATSAATQDPQVVTPRFYNVQLGGWKAPAAHRWQGPALAATPQWRAQPDEFVYGAMLGPDGTSWVNLARDVGHGVFEGYLTAHDRHGTDRRFGPLWRVESPSRRFTGSMALHADGRVFLATPSHVRSAGRSWISESGEILAVDPASGSVTTVVSSSDLVPFLGSFHDADVFGLHWRRADDGEMELAFGLSLMGTTSRMDLLTWDAAVGLSHVRVLRDLPTGMVHFDDNAPDLVAHGDDLYLVTPFVVPFGHGNPIEPATLWHIDLASGTDTRLATIAFDPGVELRGFQGLALHHDGQLSYGRRYSMGTSRPVGYELMRYDPHSETHASAGQVVTLPNHSGVPAISRFVLYQHTLSPAGAADIDHDFGLTRADLDVYSALFTASHPRADLDADLDVDIEDALVFLRSWFGQR